MSPAIITLIILAFAAFFFITDKLPIALTSMLVATALSVTGILEPTEAFKGFADGTVILFGAMFIVGDALFQTGMAYRIGKFCAGKAKTDRQLIVIIMTVTATLSSVPSITGTIAVLLPVVIGISAATGNSGEMGFSGTFYGVTDPVEGTFNTQTKTFTAAS